MVVPYEQYPHILSNHCFLLALCLFRIPSSCLVELHHKEIPPQRLEVNAFFEETRKMKVLDEQAHTHFDSSSAHKAFLISNVHCCYYVFILDPGMSQMISCQSSFFLIK